MPTAETKENVIKALADFVIRVSSVDSAKTPEEVKVLPLVAELLLRTD